VRERERERERESERESERGRERESEREREREREKMRESVWREHASLLQTTQDPTTNEAHFQRFRHVDRRVGTRGPQKSYGRDPLGLILTCWMPASKFTST
jgi:hypothetical protein